MKFQKPIQITAGLLFAACAAVAWQPLAGMMAPDVGTFSDYRIQKPGTFHKITVQDIPDRKSTRLNSSHIQKSRMPSSA